MTIKELKKRWEEFGGIPTNSDVEIEVNFYYWEKGTYRFDIWNWFDEKFPNGIAEYVI
ncbi:MAG: hypothetical protein MH472_08015 [Bacteroidia bacterium]|nr:hypothetical protein [Bacteroidia bacterium]